MTTTVGVRIYPNEEGDLIFSEPGQYGKDKDGIWWARVPVTGIGVGRLSLHEITEHEDSTITVSPSILCEGGVNGTQSWHGFLERGVWREV